MFPDSQIAQRMKLGKTKCMYFCIYGLGKYKHYRFLAKVKNTPHYSISFDESLNMKMQECQLDIILRYWDAEAAQVKVRYFDSKFLLRPNEANLSKLIAETLHTVDDGQKQVQLAMDGPHLNWSIKKSMDSARAEKELLPLIDVGSCGLHVIHGAFQTGMKAAGWDLDRVMKGMFHLFDMSPARRSIYMEVTESELFALR